MHAEWRLAAVANCSCRDSQHADVKCLKIVAKSAVTQSLCLCQWSARSRATSQKVGAVSTCRWARGKHFHGLIRPRRCAGFKYPGQAGPLNGAPVKIGLAHGWYMRLTVQGTNGHDARRSSLCWLPECQGRKLLRIMETNCVRELSLVPVWRKPVVIADISCWATRGRQNYCDRCGEPANA
eukprot:363759-Chlamydomonas_euryale.AAC.25